jgi:hypothetical protein
MIKWNCEYFLTTNHFFLKHSYNLTVAELVPKLNREKKIAKATPEDMPHREHSTVAAKLGSRILLGKGPRFHA